MRLKIVARQQSHDIIFRLVRTICTAEMAIRTITIFKRPCRWKNNILGHTLTFFKTYLEYVRHYLPMHIYYFICIFFLSCIFNRCSAGYNSILQLCLYFILYKARRLHYFRVISVNIFQFNPSQITTVHVLYAINKD